MFIALEKRRGMLSLYLVNALLLDKPVDKKLCISILRSK